MLYDFIAENQDEILRRAAVVAREKVPSARTEPVLHHGLRAILRQVHSRLGESAGTVPPHSSDVTAEGESHGEQLHEAGDPMPGVVFDYGAVCHAITSLASDKHEAISPRDFQTLNMTLDEGIAAAMDAFASRGVERAHLEQRERVGFLAHEMRNALAAAITAFQALRAERVDIGSQTGAVLERSLGRLQRIVERAVEDVRHLPSATHRERLQARDLFGDVDSLMGAEALARGIDLRFDIDEEAEHIDFAGDRQHLVSAVSNLVQNGIKFTPRGGRVLVSAHAREGNLRLRVADECGGLPAEKADELFRPFVQRASDRTGLGLGLTITQRTVGAHGGELSVTNRPGHGCVFEILLHGCRE